MKYASGRLALSLCDKCGLTFPYRRIANEPGTGYRVCSGCNDRAYNLLDHPQNHIGDAFRMPEGIALRYPRPDTVMAVDFEADDVFQQQPYVPGGES